MLSGKDVNFDDERQILTINGEKHAIKDSEIAEEVAALTETVGDNTAGLVKDVDDLTERVTTLEAGAVTYTDVTILPDTTGHTDPTVSQGGACYEKLVTYEALGVARDKILTVIPINWADLKKSFSLYLGLTTLTAMSNDDASIYNSALSSLEVRVLHIV